MKNYAHIVAGDWITRDLLWGNPSADLIECWDHDEAIHYEVERNGTGAGASWEDPVSVNVSAFEADSDTTSEPFPISEIQEFEIDVATWRRATE